MNPNLSSLFTINTITTIATAFGIAFVAALWLSLIFWARRDIRRRTRDHLLRIVSVLVVIILFIPGVLIYLILRPARTLEEEYQQTLEEEALLRSIEDLPVCPGCNRSVQPDWLICPSCHVKIRKKCTSCGKYLELSWNMCPFCAAIAPEDAVQEVS